MPGGLSTNSPESQTVQEIQPNTVSDFIIQRLNQESRGQQLIKDTIQSLWYRWQQHKQRNTDLVLTDVLLKETQESILTEQGTLALTPDYAGTQIHLVLKGSFQKRRRTPLSLSDFSYQYELPLLHQSFVSDIPQARVLLDESLLLEVVSVSDTEMEVILHTQGVPDLYLKGPHLLSVTYGEIVTEQYINIGSPAPVDTLVPQVDSVEILPNDQQEPALLLLKGRHFMLYPKFSYAMVDGDFVFGYQTEIFREGRAETVLHVPEGFDETQVHTLTYATPFGTQYLRFGGVNP